MLPFSNPLWRLRFGLILWHINHCRLFNTKSIFIHINFYLSLIGIILRWGFLIWELIFIYCGLFHYVSAKFHLWPSSGDLPRPRIGMLSLVTVSPVITAFHSCCLSHHVFYQVNLWPAWVGFETAIFWQCSHGTVEVKFGRNVVKEETTHTKKKKKKKNTKMRTKIPQ